MREINKNMGATGSRAVAASRLIRSGCVRHEVRPGVRCASAIPPSVRLRRTQAVAGESFGFTLIELMIVVLIVGILAAVAYPSYTRHIIKARRASAESYMMHIASLEEQILLDSRNYFPGSTAGGTWNTPLPTPATDDMKDFYDYEVKVPNPGGAAISYLIIATPKAGSAQASDPQLQLTNTGTKSPPGYW